MTDLAKLIADLELANEGSHDLRNRFMNAIGYTWDNDSNVWFSERHDHFLLASFNPLENLQDAVDAVPDHFRYILDKRADAKHRRDGYRAHVWYGVTPAYEATQSWAATDPLALCIAILKATDETKSA